MYSISYTKPQLRWICQLQRRLRSLNAIITSHAQTFQEQMKQCPITQVTHTKFCLARAYSWDRSNPRRLWRAASQRTLLLIRRHCSRYSDLRATEKFHATAYRASSNVCPANVYSRGWKKIVFTTWRRRWIYVYTKFNKAQCALSHVFYEKLGPVQQSRSKRLHTICSFHFLVKCKQK